MCDNKMMMMIHHIVWCNGYRSDSWSRGHGFNSRPFHC